MTTVINLNILNVFGHNIEKHSVRNSQSAPDSSKRRDISIPEHRTIDVTPAKAHVSQYKPILKKIREVPCTANEQPEVLTCHPQKCETRLLDAYSTGRFLPKGTHIDSYA